MSVWVTSLNAVAQLCSLQHIALSADTILTVQAYLVSGTDIHRYVISGVDPGEDPDYLRDNKRCHTHEVLLVRYMGADRTCLLTLRGPLKPLNRLFYNGCVEWLSTASSFLSRASALLPLFSPWSHEHFLLFPKTGFQRRRNCFPSTTKV